ncbi:LOW QUALITY PROTEIN: filamin-binding LIM protein 1-like [Gastrophryne carolinensis]
MGEASELLSKQTFPGGSLYTVFTGGGNSSVFVAVLLPCLAIPPPPPPPPLDSLSLELQKAHSEMQLKSAPPPAPSLVKPQSLLTNPPKREDPAPGRQNFNGYNGKTESLEICAFCHKTIPPPIEAMKKQYYASCLTCRKCHRLLAAQLYYQKDGQPNCEHCYKDTLEKCAKCQTLFPMARTKCCRISYHPECFRCVVCERMIADESFAVDEYNDVHCGDNYYRKYAPTCGLCELPIILNNGQDSYKIECIGRSYHEYCYHCEKCQVLLSLEPTDSGCYPLKGHLLCKQCHLSWKDELS